MGVNQTRRWSAGWLAAATLLGILAAFLFVGGLPALSPGANRGIGVLWLAVAAYCLLRARPKKSAADGALPEDIS
jgi:hypothetical protein